MVAVRMGVMGRWACRALMVLTLPFCLGPHEGIAAERQGPTIDQLRQQLAAAPGHGGAQYMLAAALARAGQLEERALLLEKALRQGLDFNLLEDDAFAAMRAAKENQALLAIAARNRLVRIQSSVAVRLPERDLFPEGIAYDPVERAIYLGSLSKRKIVRVGPDGKSVDFVTTGRDGIWAVVGMKVDAGRRVLWACSAAGREAGSAYGSSGLFAFDVTSGKLLRKALLDNRSGTHFLNDLAMTRAGDVYVTDSNEGSVYRLRHDGERLEIVLEAERFIYPNGIALSEDESRLYVADYSRGISVMDMRTKQVRTLVHPDDISVDGIDGLYVVKGGLLGVQNGAGAERIVRYEPSPDGDRVTAMSVLESRHPLYKVPTTGVVVGTDFYYIATSQIDNLGDDSKAIAENDLREIVVLKLPL